jgi:hypothetical protein
MATDDSSTASAVEATSPAGTCFVIMPITVPGHLLETRYGGREDHFEKVYKALIAPAVTKAGLTPSPPRREGTDNIQARIINDLQTAHLVLADLSALNPNVFLELGIRSALDKPVCLVWDGGDRLPFDTGTLSTHKYNPHPIYELNDEIESLARHIAATMLKSDGRNELWKFFGRASDSLPAAQLNPDDATIASKLDRVLELIEMPRSAPGHASMRREVSTLAEAVTERLEQAGSAGVHGTVVGRLAREYLGTGYDSFIAGRSLSGALRAVGVPIRTDSSGKFYLDDQEERGVTVDASLEAILQELRDRGIGHR